MSSPLVCTQPATGNPAAFVPLSAPALLERLSGATHISGITPASRLQIRPHPQLAPTGISHLDALTGGLPRGCLTEIYGLPSSGRTSITLSVIAAATRRPEACALVDVSNAFDPHSAAASGIDLRQLLWIRCDSAAGKKIPASSHPATPTQAAMSRMAQALKVIDLLVQSGGLGLIVIDLGDLPHSASRRIPLASWFRFRRAIENTPTLLLVVSQAPCARTCASLLLRLEQQSSIVGGTSSSPSLITARKRPLRAGIADLEKLTVHNFVQATPVQPETPAHGHILQGLSVHVELERSRLERKPAQSDKTNFRARTPWCG
jgi:hypothetical protein